MADNIICKVKLAETAGGEAIYNNPEEGGGDVITICGEHGCGKTRQAIELIRQYAENGAAVVVLDVYGSFSDDQLMAFGVDQDALNIARIDASVTGVPCGILSRISSGEKLESDDSMALFYNRITKTFDVTDKCRKEIWSVINSRRVVERMKTIGFRAWTEAAQNAVNVLGTQISSEFITKLKPLAEGNYLTAEKPVYPGGGISIIDLTKVPRRSAWGFVEIILTDIWQSASENVFKSHGLVIAIDEAHEAYFGDDGAIRKIIDMGRKYRLGLILISQDIRSSKIMFKRVSASDYRLYFRQRTENARYFAKILMPRDVAKITSELSNMPIGGMLIEGTKEFEGCTITAPMYGYNVLE